MSHSKQRTPAAPKFPEPPKPPAGMSIRQRRAEIADVLVQALLTKLFADSAARSASSSSAPGTGS